MQNKFLKYLPNNEFWRLFIDGHRQSEGWAGFEKREPGYLLAMGAAFSYGNQNFQKNKENLRSFIKNLHYFSVNKVSNTNYSKNHVNPREFNENYAVGFRLICNTGGEKNTLTSNGLKQIINKIGQKGYLLQDKTILNYSNADLPCEVIIPDTGKKITENNVEDIIGKSEKSDFPENVEYSYFIRHSTKIIKMNQIVDNYIFVYMEKIQVATNWQEKLEAIVEFIQDLEQCHPFNDGNLRTFGMLLLQFLLEDNDMPLSILNDPNVFDGYSREELKNEVIVGMKNFLSLLDNDYLDDVNINQEIISEIRNYEVKSKVKKMPNEKSQDIIPSQGKLPKQLHKLGYKNHDDYYNAFLCRIKRKSHRSKEEIASNIKDYDYKNTLGRSYDALIFSRK